MTEPVTEGISILGIPYDASSSYMMGPAGGPAAIRAALHSGASNWCDEDGVDLSASEDWEDAGDIALSSTETAMTTIESSVADLHARSRRVLALGGDHAVLYPIIRATRPRFDSLTIIQLDAHPDLYDELDGNRYSHACPAARIMESFPDTRLIQIGIRTLNPHQKAQAERFGVEIIPAREWSVEALPEISGPVYLSLDLDVLDPAFAPGVSHHEPGGLTSREVIQVIQHLPETVVGADVVELNPKRDPIGITAAVAAKCLKEIMSKMIHSLPVHSLQIQSRTGHRTGN
jgi:agmatinase